MTIQKPQFLIALVLAMPSVPDRSAEAAAASPMKVCAFPLTAHMDGDSQETKTSLVLKVPLLEIQQPLAEWLSEKHEAPDDDALSAVLQAIQKKQGALLKSLVLPSKGFGIDDANGFASDMYESCFPDGSRTVIAGKTFTDQGVLYTLNYTGKEPHSANVMLRAVDPARRKYLWEVMPERKADAVLAASFSMLHATISNGVAGKWSPAVLTEAFIQAVSKDAAVYQGISNCVKLVVSSRMKEGLTRKSRDMVDVGLAGDDVMKQFAGEHADIKFVVDTNPLYIAFFKGSSGLHHLYFTRRKGDGFLLTNFNQSDELDEFVSEFKDDPAVQNLSPSKK